MRPMIHRKSKENQDSNKCIGTKIHVCSPQNLLHYTGQERTSRCVCTVCEELYTFSPISVARQHMSAPSVQDSGCGVSSALRGCTDDPGHQGAGGGGSEQSTKGGSGRETSPSSASSSPGRWASIPASLQAWRKGASFHRPPPPPTPFTGPPGPTTSSELLPKHLPPLFIHQGKSGLFLGT